jgi:hypothetical protein
MAEPHATKSIYRKTDTVRSAVLPELALKVADVFAD